MDVHATIISKQLTEDAERRMYVRYLRLETGLVYLIKSVLFLSCIDGVCVCVGQVHG